MVVSLLSIFNTSPIGYVDVTGIIYRRWFSFHLFN